MGCNAGIDAVSFCLGAALSPAYNPDLNGTAVIAVYCKRTFAEEEVIETLRNASPRVRSRRGSLNLWLSWLFVFNHSPKSALRTDPVCVFLFRASPQRYKIKEAIGAG